MDLLVFIKTSVIRPEQNDRQRANQKDNREQAFPLRCALLSAKSQDFVYCQLARMNAIRNANASIAISRQRETRVILQRGVNAFENFWMTKVVLWHGIFPHKD